MSDRAHSSVFGKRFCRTAVGFSGMALVLVLAAIVLLSVLLVAFLASVKIERTAAGSQLNQTEARLLSENVLGLVTAQIREATTQTNTAWASQPGLIRTYSSGGNKTYKLYSSDDMIAANFDPAAGTDVPTDWSTRLDQFVDLNSPATVSSNGTSVKSYPILDPALAWNATGGTGIKGFLNNSTSSNMVASGSNANPLPMPVRWLYVLQDGTLQAMNSSGKVTSASAANPIIGRIAFWADDESCKININTASQGTFWDVPRGKGNTFEMGSYSTGSFNMTARGLAVSQPYRGEYQRYPGHPATTSLGVVLDSLDPATGKPLFFPAITDPIQRRENIFGLIPRINAGGSKGGTVSSDPNTATAPVSADTDRLYASVDELAFSGAFTGTNRISNISTTSARSGLSTDTIQKLNFFLTANSRTPEVTLFNTPRMTIWPVDADPAKRSIFEKTIAACSTLKNPLTSTATELILTRHGFDPTEYKPAHLGVAPTKSGSLSPTIDFDAHNAALYSFLQRSTARSVPGFGSTTFSSKYGADRDQILTEIFDYIRCINLFDKTTSTSNPFTARPWLIGTPASWDLTAYQNYPTQAIGGTQQTYYLPSPFFGQVVPLRINSTQGFGRMAVVTGAALVFYGYEPADLSKKWINGAPTATDRTNYDLGNSGNNTVSPQGYGNATSSPAQSMQAMLILTMSVPSAGPIDYHHRYDQRVTVLNAFTVTNNSTTTNLGFPASATNQVFLAPNPATTLQGGAPEWEFNSYLKTTGNTFSSLTKQGTGPDGGIANYPFVSAVIPIAGNTFSCSGGRINVDTLVAGQVVQSTEIEFQPFTAPTPQWSNLGSAFTSGNSTINRFCDRSWWKMRSSYGGNPPWPTIVTAQTLTNAPVNKSGTLFSDVVRMMELKSGDPRMLAARQSVTKDFFVAHAKYTDPNVLQAHSLRYHTDGLYGALVSASPNDSFNAISSGVNAALRADSSPGDWDMGPPVASVYTTFGDNCGGFINKADDASAGYYDQNGNPAEPYFSVNSSIVSSDRSFSPNRMIPSAVMFGSLPTGVARHDPLTNDLSWQTLLFRPNGQTTGTHPGSASPPDHLLLDLFNMPVVEPYAISEPFSSSGKVNMNYQIAPFTYITRDTGMRAALDAIRITAIPSANASLRNYGPTGGNTATDKKTNYRYPVDADATLMLFADRFANNNPFKSSSEICDMFLVPKPENKPSPTAPDAPSINPYQTQPPTNGTAAQVLDYVQTFWQSASGGAGTADNLRERPYAALYPRLTTKSNTYTVHLRAQSLKKRPGSDPQTFDQTKDIVTSEYRGSFMIERFLDPNASTFDITDSTSTLGPYKFRVINTKQFNP